jgi:hypothetical protein
MNPKVFNTAIIVVGDQHNPSILHPYFLEKQEILPPDWEVTGDFICTPPFSRIAFTNGVVFLVESTRLQISDDMPPGDLKDGKIHEVARKYITTLPHVKYTAVGINISMIIEHPDADELIMNQFLRSGVWNEGVRKPIAFSTRLVYQVDEAKLRLSISSGKVTQVGQGDETSGILLKANYHTDLLEETMDSNLKKIDEILSLMPERQKHLNEIIEEFFGSENSGS